MVNVLIGATAGVVVWGLINGVDAVVGRTRQRLRRAELRVKTLQQQLSGTSKALNREKSRAAAQLVEIDSRHQEEVDGLNAKVERLTVENKNLHNLLEQKWEGAKNDQNQQ